MPSSKNLLYSEAFLVYKVHARQQIYFKKTTNICTNVIKITFYFRANFLQV